MNRESGSPDAARRRLAVRIAVLLQGWERHRREGVVQAKLLSF